jgi:hypothetical protein
MPFNGPLAVIRALVPSGGSMRGSWRTPAAPVEPLLAPSGAWTDIGLTLPVFVLYHLGVIFLPVRNAADVVTQELVALAHQSRPGYIGLTLGVGVFILAILLALGRRQVFRWQSFVALSVEGLLYAVAMRMVAAAVVGRLYLGVGIEQRFAGLVMSLGAGLYEEVAFRVLLFGVGLRCWRVLLGPLPTYKGFLFGVGWACVSALSFSAWHHLGTFAEDFDGHVFLFRSVCGLVFTLIYVTRGFAPVVWTHILYDLWVLQS